MIAGSRDCVGVAHAGRPWPAVPAPEVLIPRRGARASSSITPACRAREWVPTDRVPSSASGRRESPAGYLDHCVRPDPQDYGQRSRRARLVDAEVHRIISGSHAEARRLLVEHREPLDALAAGLLERETLNEQEILQITGLSPAPASTTSSSSGRRPMAHSACRSMWGHDGEALEGGRGGHEQAVPSPVDRE